MTFTGGCHEITIILCIGNDNDNQTHTQTILCRQIIAYYLCEPISEILFVFFFVLCLPFLFHFIFLISTLTIFSLSNWSLLFVPHFLFMLLVFFPLVNRCLQISPESILFSLCIEYSTFYRNTHTVYMNHNHYSRCEKKCVFFCICTMTMWINEHFFFDLG